MISQKKIRTVFLFIAAMLELMIALPSALYLKMESISFLLVILTALIGAGSIAYFVLDHGRDSMN